MKVFVIFAVIAAWVSSSEATSCQDVISCTPDMSKLQGDNPNVEEGCKIIRQAMTCLRSALADCRKNPNLPKSTVDALEQQLSSYDDMINKQCGDSGAGGAVKASVAATLLSVFGYLLL